MSAIVVGQVFGRLTVLARAVVVAIAATIAATGPSGSSRSPRPGGGHRAELGSRRCG